MGIKINANLKIYLLFLALCLCAYFNALNNDFVFDDKFIVVNNAHIKNISFIPKLFQEDIFHFQHLENDSLGIYYRPMQAVSHVLDYALWKLEPCGYRLQSILLHSLNSFLLYLLLLRLFKARGLAVLSALIFCIHPIQVSDVAFISVRSVPLELAFMLLSILAMLRCLSGVRPLLNYLLSLALFVPAFLSREDALLLPMFIFLSALVLGIKKSRVLLRIIPFIILAVLYIALRHGFIPCEKLFLKNTLTIGNVKGFFWYLLEYGRQLVLPISAQQFILQGCPIGRSLLLLASFVLLALSLFRALAYRDKRFIFGLGFYFIGLLPVAKLSDNIRFLAPILSEHYVYIPAAGFFVLLALFLLDVRTHLKGAGNVLIGVLIVAYLALTVYGNTKYKDEITFYNHILSFDSSHTLVRINLGAAYYEKGMYEQAQREARAVLAADRGAWDAYLLLGNIAKDKRKFGEALEFYRKALALYPRSSEALNNMALIYAAEGNDLKAYDTFKQAVDAAPEFLVVLDNFSSFLIQKKDYPEAARLCLRILKFDPAHIGARLRLGIVLAEGGHVREAEKVFREAVRLAPRSAEARRNLGVLYANRGDWDLAISTWQEALKIDPDNAALKDNIVRAKGLKAGIKR